MLTTLCLTIPPPEEAIDVEDIAAIVGVLVSLLTVLAIVWVNRRGARDNLIASLVDAYSKAMQVKADAYDATTTAAQTALAEAHFDALVNLHWMEFQLWKRRAVENSLFWGWANTRRVAYQSGLAVHGITYAARWDVFKKVNGSFAEDYTRMMDDLLPKQAEDVVTWEKENRASWYGVRFWMPSRKLRTPK